MGLLPEEHVNPSHAFTYNGVDYAGPIEVKTGRGHYYRCSKGYLCLFICLLTKANHIELVRDCTGESFIGALKRFTARRGLVRKIFSEYCTNFVRAEKDPNKRYHDVTTSLPPEVSYHLLDSGIDWQFIPPAS